MKPQNKLLLGTFLLLLFMIILMFWLVIGNRGSLIITHLEGPYTLVVEKYRAFSCDSGSCRFSLPFGQHQICIVKPGYKESCQAVKILWRQDVSLQPELKKIPVLTDAPPRQASEQQADLFAANPLKTATAVGKQYFFQPASGELFEQVSVDESQSVRIATFNGLVDPQLFPLGENILILSQSEIFLVDTKRHARKRIYSGTTLSLKPLTDMLALIADVDKLLLYDATTGKSEVLPFVIPVGWAVICDDRKILAAANDTGGNIRFFQYDLASGTESPLTSAVGIIEDFSLRCGSAQNSVLLDFESGKRLELTY